MTPSTSTNPTTNNQVPTNSTGPSDFSIDHILNRAGCSQGDDPKRDEELAWLHCSRYCPPKIPRAQKRDPPQRRQLGRHPRIPFSSQQLSVLEDKFQRCPYLSSEEVMHLAGRLQLAEIRVKIWFQNRRARERREKSHENASNCPQ